jgi:hypothetical protein
MGETTDHISEASVSDLSKAMDGVRFLFLPLFLSLTRCIQARAKSSDRGASDALRDLLFKIPGSSSSSLNNEMQGVEEVRSRAANGGANSMSPQELHAALWKILTFRDDVVQTIEKTIEKIPGLSSLVEKVSLIPFCFILGY